MKHLKKFTLFLILPAILTACGGSASVCPPGSVTYAEDGSAFPTTGNRPGTAAAPAQVEIGRKTVAVDRVISGPLCNETLDGTVYVACDVRVKKWSGKPTFLNGCEFNVSPGSVIYVAAHNNAAYYNGCVSCHAGGAEEP